MVFGWNFFGWNSQADDLVEDDASSETFGRASDEDEEIDMEISSGSEAEELDELFDDIDEAPAVDPYEFYEHTEEVEDEDPYEPYEHTELVDEDPYEPFEHTEELDRSSESTGLSEEPMSPDGITLLYDDFIPRPSGSPATPTRKSSSPKSPTYSPLSGTTPASSKYSSIKSPHSTSYSPTSPVGTRTSSTVRSPFRSPSLASALRGSRSPDWYTATGSPRKSSTPSTYVTAPTHISRSPTPVIPSTPTLLPRQPSHSTSPATPLGPNTTFEDFLRQNRPATTKPSGRRPFQPWKIEKVEPLRYQNVLRRPRRLPNTPTRDHLPPSPRRTKGGKVVPKSCPTCGRAFSRATPASGKKGKKMGRPAGSGGGARTTPAAAAMLPTAVVMIPAVTPATAPAGLRRSTRTAKKPKRYT